ncbi:MAG: hypothetical protein ACTHK7_24490 [Aureliella sp.]
MESPYAAPRHLENSSSRVGTRLHRSFSRGIIFGLGGYFTPFVILVPMFCIKFGSYPNGDMITGLAAWHWPVTAAGYALLIPNIACLMFFGSFGYARASLLPRPNRNDGRLLLGLATLVGYFCMLTLVFVLRPLPSAWSGELTNLIQSGFVMAFPIGLLICLCVRNGNASRSGRTTACTEAAEGS